MASLVLVRHAMPHVRGDVPPDEWHLGPSGHAAARRLAAALPADSLVVTSDEAKARETAEEIVAVRGGTIRVDARVAELRRPFEWSDDHRGRARAYLAGSHDSGGTAHDERSDWEPPDEVLRRFEAGVRDALDARVGASGDADRANPAEPVIVVTHGLAMTLWLRGIGAIDDAGAFWAALCFPDAWDVSLRDGRAAASRRSASATLPTRS